MKFRPLKTNEIEIRLDRITPKGAWLLLYKNARIDMALLDEVVGEENWQRDHKKVKENMYAGVAIYSDTKKEWVWKWDCGTESQAAKEKGEASDSFKRACANWGIGRELYTAPDIFVPCPTEKNDKGKYELKDKYIFDDAYVSNISYTEKDGMRVIKDLAIADKKGNVIWSNMGKPARPIDPDQPVEEEDIDLNAPINAVQKKSLEERLQRLDYPLSKVLEAFKITSLKEMTVAMLVHCNTQLANIEDKRAKKAKEAKK